MRERQGLCDVGEIEVVGRIKGRVRNGDRLFLDKGRRLFHNVYKQPLTLESCSILIKLMI